MLDKHFYPMRVLYIELLLYFKKYTHSFSNKRPLSSNTVSSIHKVNNRLYSSCTHQILDYLKKSLVPTRK